MIFLIEALFPLETLREMIGKEFGFPSEDRMQGVIKMLAGLSLPRRHIIAALLPHLLHRIQSKSAKIQAALEKVASKNLIAGKLDAALRSSMLKTFIAPVLDGILIMGEEVDNGNWREWEANERTVTRAEQRSKFIQAVCKAELYRAGTTDAEQGWGDVLESVLTSALDYMLEHPTTESFPQHASIATSIWSMDSHLARESLQRGLECVLSYLPCSPRDADAQAERLFNVMLSASVRMRAMPEFIQRLSQATLSSFDAMRRLLNSSPSIDIKRRLGHDSKAVSEKLATCPPFLGATFRHAIRNSVSPLQATEVVSSAVRRCSALLEQISSSLTSEEARSNGEVQILRLSLELDLAALILAELTFPDALLEDLLERVSSLVNHVLNFTQDVQAYAQGAARSWQHDYSLFDCSLLNLFTAISAVLARVDQTTPFERVLERLDKVLFASPRSLDRDFASDHQRYRYVSDIIQELEQC